MTDLKNTTWYIPAGWRAPSAFGYYFIECAIQYSADDCITDMFQLGYISHIDSFDKIILTPKADSVAYLCRETVPTTFSNTEDFTITILGGSDTKNSDLISWLEQYGQQQTPLLIRRTAVPEGNYADIIYGNSIIATLVVGKEVTLNCAGKAATAEIIIKSVEMNLEIIYNSEVIATLSPGKMATIPPGRKFLSDIIIHAIKDEPESNFILSDGNLFITSDGFIFTVKDESNFLLPNGDVVVTKEGLIFTSKEN